MVRSRIEHAQAILIDALRELDPSDARERAVFEACLVASRRLGDARELCDESSEGSARGVRLAA